MKNPILSIEIDWYSTKDGEFYRKFTVGEEGGDGKCVEITRTDEGSYLILFDDGRTYETFNQSTVYRVPEDHEMLKKVN
jgi:hypothetical protein